MLHEHAGGDEDQQQAGNEAINTGGLGQSDTQNHGAGNVAFALGIAADDFTGTGGAVTFADTDRYQRSEPDRRQCRNLPEQCL